MPASRFARRILPTPANLVQWPGLRWLGHYLEKRPWLWVAHRRKVALGAALGLGLGVLPMMGQTVLAGAAAVYLRANVAAAVSATWLTNPFTLVPIWALAIWLGGLVLPGAEVIEPVIMQPKLEWNHPATWWPILSDWVLAMGKPLLVGLPMAGVVLGVALYVLIYYGWWAVISYERRRRLRERARR
jgi:uncharacterized protein (DUF2062 family)